MSPLSPGERDLTMNTLDSKGALALGALVLAPVFPLTIMKQEIQRGSPLEWILHGA